MAQRNYNTPYYQSLHLHSLQRQIARENARIKEEKKIIQLQDKLQSLRNVSPLKEDYSKMLEEIRDNPPEVDEKWSWG